MMSTWYFNILLFLPLDMLVPNKKENGQKEENNPRKNTVKRYSLIGRTAWKHKNEKRY